MPSALAPGAQLGPYEIVCLLGAGGMGEVYRARDPRLSRDVAIKVLPADLASDPNRLERVYQEARATAALNQPNVLAIHDIGEHDGRPFLVSELLEGETLRSRLDRGPLPAGKAMDYARQIALGLAAAHAKGIVHRDLKPENVFLTDDGRLKILDFGLARFARTDDAGDGVWGGVFVATVTSPGAILGTVGYMSPEQVRGMPVDARSDIFSLGAVLYEMLTGRRAFHGDTPSDTLAAILTQDPPPAKTTAGDVPKSLGVIIRRCLEKAPDERFQTARDLSIALEAVSSDSIAPIGGWAHVTGRVRTPGRWRAGLAFALLAGGLLALGWRVYPQTWSQTTGDSPKIAHAQDGPFIYVTNANSNSVSVISGVTWVPTTTIAVGVRPVGIAFNQPRAEIYVANGASGDISVIDCASNRAVATIATGAGSYGVAFSHDGTRAYVSNAGSKTVTIIDTSSRTVIATISGLGQAQGIAVSPDGARLYVVNEDNVGTVSVIDLVNYTETTRVEVGGSYPVGIALTPDGRRAYVTVGQNGDPFVAVLDTATNKTAGVIRAAPTAATLPAITPDGSRLCIPNTGSDTVSVIDTSTNRVVATIPVGKGPYAAAISPDARHAFVTNANAASLSVIDLRSNAVVATATGNLGSIPSGIAVSAFSIASRSGATRAVSSGGR